MVLPPILLQRIINDLGLDVPFINGQVKKVKNCWHFSTDGNAVDILFSDEADFKAGMNRAYVVLRSYDVVILAFSLMDTHVHFVLYGTFDECNRFVHDFIKRTSMYIAARHGERHRLENVPIHHQEVDTEDYLKTVICYVIKNAPVGGIPFQGVDYPWSSGPLYFRKQGWWSSPRWLSEVAGSKKTIREIWETLKTRSIEAREDLIMIDDIIFPGEYVAYEIVEKLFRTHKAFSFFMCRSRELDVESRGGAISRLSIPIQEMKQHRNRICGELFGHESVRRLDTTQRLRLARELRSRYNSSLKQVIRLSGLVYEEVKDKFR